MAESLHAAIKSILLEELQEVHGRLRQQDERCAAVEAQLEGLAGSLREQRCDTTQLRADLDGQSREMRAVAEQARSDLEGAVAALRQSLDRHESEEEGLGGLPGLGGLQKVCSRLTQEQSTLVAAMDSHRRVVATNKSRIDGFEEQLGRLAAECEESSGISRRSAEQVQKIEAESSSVGERQQLLEDSVAQKYESLWQDVLHSMERLKGQHTEVLKQDLERQKEDAKVASKSSIRHMNQLVAAVHDERRKLAVSKDLMTQWREQAWVGARRRSGLRLLAGAINSLGRRRQLKVMSRWVHFTSIENLAERLRQEYSAQIPDVMGVLDGTGLPSKCSELTEAVEALQQGQSELQRLQETVSGTSVLVEQHTCDLQKVQGNIEKVDLKVDGEHQLVQGLAEKLDGFAESINTTLTCTRGEYGERFDGLGDRCSALDEALSACAKAKDVQDVMRDVLLVWSSIKQLDSAKADKKEVDSFALESINRDKQYHRSLQDLKAEVDELPRDPAGEISWQDRCGELEKQLSDNSKQVQHWEQMWERLTAHVEELVAKVGDLQSAARLPPSTLLPEGCQDVAAAAAAVAAVAAHGAGRQRSGSRSRMDIPLLRQQRSCSSDKGLEAGSSTDRGGKPGGLADDMVTTTKLAPTRGGGDAVRTEKARRRSLAGAEGLVIEAEPCGPAPVAGPAGKAFAPASRGRAAGGAAAPPRPRSATARAGSASRSWG